jgi:hypothetical protein
MTGSVSVIANTISIIKPDGTIEEGMWENYSFKGRI